MSPARAYLDHNATTPILPDAAAAVAEALALCGNPSSLHAAGRDAARALSAARGDVARWLGASPGEIVFTSGGTEADRLAILGALRAAAPRRHVVASAIEHAAVRDLLRALAADGVETTWVRPEPSGRVAAEAFAAALRDDTALVALMGANNETGVLQPVADVAAIARAHGVAMLVDAVQSAGKVAADVATGGADLVAVSAHKIHGPRGAGALVVRTPGRWRAPFPASHEGGRRAGTEALPAIAGFAAAARRAAALTAADRAATAALRDRLEQALVGALPGVRVNGTADRLPNTSNLAFSGIESERLLASLDRAGIDAGDGSACASGSAEPSHVLVAMGLSPRDARSCVRFSLGATTSRDDVDRAVAATIEAVETLRSGARW